MYITSGLYQPYAKYLDLSDIAFFHNSLKFAKEKYYLNKEEYDSLSKSEINDIKKRHMIVMFASTVSNRSNDDILISRPEMNERARRKYLIIDADFDSNQDNESQQLIDDLKSLAAEFATPLIIYPTASYPEKPRFRAVLFTKSSMNESSYYQAMTWLYQMLGREPLDNSDLKIRSNNNAPFFVNEEQIEMIYDTTQDNNLKPLDNILWKNFDKPKIKRQKPIKESAFDKIEIQEDVLKEACEAFAKSSQAKHFNTFWPILHSLARAEYFGQIDEQLVQKALIWIAQVPGQSTNATKWSLENKQQYKHEKSRVFSNEKILHNARPLCNIESFKNVFLKHNIMV